MTRGSKKITVTNNPNVYVCADELEEGDDYIKTAASDEKIPFIVQSHLPLAVYWGFLFISMTIRVYLTTITLAKLSNELKDLQDFSQHLEKSHGNLEVMIHNLTVDKFLLKDNISNLSEEKKKMNAEIQQLTAMNQSLNEEIQRFKGRCEIRQPHVTRNILDHYTTTAPILWTDTNYFRNNAASVSPWISRSYHYRGKRQSEPCERGWLQFQSSCYVIGSHDSLDQKTWEGARDDCRGKNADLAVIESPEEQDFIYSSLAGLGATDYWIGLRMEGGSWKWVNRRDLTDSYWIKPPAENHLCGISVKDTKGWRAVSCDVKNGWICKQSALPG